MAEKKFKAVLEIGGALGSSLKTSFLTLAGNTKRLGASLKDLNTKAKTLRDEMKQGLGGADAAKNLARLDRQILQTKRNIASLGALKELRDLKIGSKFRSVGRDLAIGLGTVTAASIGIGALFKTQFIDTAAQFERFNLILETLEGSQAKAKKSFDWISTFAAKTPYDLATVTDAFVKLRSYGIDPIKGDTLKILGDTSSAMGKDLSQAVEAIADAITGENERLKEFGIKGSKAAGKITYEYTNAAGKQMRKTVSASSREAIQQTLAAIWSDKYKGAMEKMSTSWGGMVSNLGDQWTRFTSQVMTSGPFAKLKDRLGSFLAEVDKMAADGRLAKYAEETGAQISKVVDAIESIASSIIKAAPDIKDFIDNIGGIKTVIIGLAALPFIPAAASITSLGLTMLSAAPGAWALASGLFAIEVAGAPAWAVLLAIGATLWSVNKIVTDITDNWDTFAWAFDEFTQKIASDWKEIQDAAFEFGWNAATAIQGAFDSLRSSLGSWFDWIEAKFRTLSKSLSVFSAFGGGVGGVAAAISSKIIAEKISGARADGGPVNAGRKYLVGERGPEIFAPRTSGQIIPNGGGGRAVNITNNFTIHPSAGMDERGLADLIVSRLDGRQAALAGGALFD